MKVEADAVFVPVDTAIPLGMVVNEMVTNAVKYAYPLPDKGLIWVVFKRERDELLLTVRDLGRGLPADLKSRAGGGIGMKLIQSLVAQVQGRLVMGGPPGTAFEIRLAAPGAG